MSILEEKQALFLTIAMLQRASTVDRSALKGRHTSKEGQRPFGFVPDRIAYVLTTSPEGAA